METDLKTATARLRDLLGADRGFTLLETLAVMVIVGLLAAITVPQIAQWRAKAYLTSTTTDAKNFANGFYAATAETGVAPSGGDAAYAEVLASTKLSKGNTFLGYGSYNDVFAFVVSNENGPYTCYHVAYGGVSTKGMKGPLACK
jgi:prepilin-type N-terminal cleavage/methylation domain-containing protein